ncbi:MAG TPA: adenylate/guanylate cyclase domain-containing protein [Acidimicrobiia bacterium]|nr:adenylate/guanylate cyclase domain-containing protein [Acidimicrobiia bacterium]
MRVERWFAFVDLSGFTSFGDQFGDDESVRVLTLFRGAVRTVATDFGVRIAKWLGDGCMLVSVDPAQLVAAVPKLETITHELELPLAMHAGCAGGGVILLEGDDYTGRSVNLASRLANAAQPHEILATVELAEYAVPGTAVEPAGMITVAGLHDPVEVVRFNCVATGDTVLR